MRIDRWLWHARFFKSRSLATELVASGRLRLNRRRITKSHGTLHPGDILVFPQDRRVRIVRVIAISTRRGPAGEAAELYEDLVPGEPLACLTCLHVEYQRFVETVC